MIFEACKQGQILHRRFPRKPPLTISVNLSVKQLQSDSIIDDVREALQLTELEPSALVLEITETVMMADPDTASSRLEELKELGVRIAMDDFGTGYSSLSYLSRLPVDILKMDRSFLAAGNTTRGWPLRSSPLESDSVSRSSLKGSSNPSRSARSEISAANSARASSSHARCRRSTSSLTSTTRATGNSGRRRRARLECSLASRPSTAPAATRASGCSARFARLVTSAFSGPE